MGSEPGPRRIDGTGAGNGLDGEGSMTGLGMTANAPAEATAP